MEVDKIWEDGRSSKWNLVEKHTPRKPTNNIALQPHYVAKNCLFSLWVKRLKSFVREVKQRQEDDNYTRPQNTFLTDINLLKSGPVDPVSKISFHWNSKLIQGRARMSYVLRFCWNGEPLQSLSIQVSKLMEKNLLRSVCKVSFD